MTAKFVFYNDLTSIPKADNNTLIAVLPKHISGKEELHNLLFKILNFPSYYGFNWDALWDCLLDFDWIDQENIILVHEDMPILNEKDIRIYISILSDAVVEWEKHEDNALYRDHNFYVMFPESCREQINAI